MRLLLLFCLISSVFSLSFLNGPRRGLSSLLVNKALDKASGNGWVTQPLDHFNTGNGKTWKQRFFFNTQFQKDSSTAALLYISGEEPASESMVSGGSIIDYANKLNAPIYALEHRFYGESIPTKDASLDSLQFLSSRQVIEDIAEFIRQKNGEKKMKWILVGASYSGDLAAWSRLKHPDLISGALASSAPLQVVMDFYGYFKVVDDDFKAIGGLCYDQMSKGFDEIQKLLQSEDGRNKLSTTFRITPPLSDYDDITDNMKSLFFAAVTQAFEIAAQIGTPSPRDVCTDLIAGGAAADPMEALASLIHIPISANFTDIIEGMRSVDFGDDLVVDRLWTYQTCTEFGWYLSSNLGTTAFGQTRSSNPGLFTCFELFGITTDQVAKNVDATNEYYGGSDYFPGTNVVFTGGSNDPWSFLGMKNSKHWSVVIANIEGGSHCSDLSAGCFSSECTEEMTKLQQLVLENMQRWIDPVFPVPDRVDITDSVGQRPQLSNPYVAPSSTGIVEKQTMIRAKRSAEMPKVSNRTSKLNVFTGKRRKISRPIGGQHIEQTEEIGQGFIEQTWDHFNPNEERTFKQKWFFNTKYGSNDGPNFLLVGGEGPEELEYVQTGAWMAYAQQVGANCYILEHRYYGDSKLGTNDLQFISSPQMIYDVATFIRTMQIKEKRTGPWITFGASNPGALAAWSREWFPELIVGAVASSATVLAKNDFYEYLEVVEDVLSRSSPKCRDRTAEAFDRLRILIQTPDGRDVIQQKFKLSPAWTANQPVSLLDIEFVFSGLYGIFQETVQFNTVDWARVHKLCSIMQDEQYEDSLDALRAVEKSFYNGEDVDTPSSNDNDIQSLIDMKNFVDGHDPLRYDDYDLADLLWTYQSCSEFGYFQTTDYGRGAFGTPVPINFYITMCEKVFGLEMANVQRGIDRTNYYFGGINRYNSTNVVFTNGDADPWKTFGILERGNKDESIVAILIEGTSHCMDFDEATPDDPYELTDARKATLDNIKRWISEETTSTTTSTTTTTMKSTTTMTTTTSGLSRVDAAISITILAMSIIF